MPRPPATVKLTSLEVDLVSYVRSHPGVTEAQLHARHGGQQKDTSSLVARLASLGYLRMRNGVITTT